MVCRTTMASLTNCFDCNNLDDCTFDFDVSFPITVEYYSENNQQFQTIEISSEEELESYLEDYCD